MEKENIRILVACERSQVVCRAFRERGFSAFSCDLLPSYGGLPEYHIKGDAYDICRRFPWHCVIAHPPCTFLSRAGARHLYSRRCFGFDWSRYQKGLLAARFFRSFLDLSEVPFVAVENPTPMILWNFPLHDCVINPWEFGHPYKKRTCLWLKGLPVLLPDTFIFTRDSWTDLHRSARVRSETFEGVASAMASQWGDFLVGAL